LKEKLFQIVVFKYTKLGLNINRDYLFSKLWDNATQSTVFQKL